MHRLTRFLLAALTFTVLAAPAAAQTRRYTNADLGKPVAHPHTLTPEEWQSIVDHQYVAVATPTWEERLRAIDGPRVVVIPDSTVQPYIPPTYPLSDPFYLSTYVGGRWWPSHESFSHDFHDTTRNRETLRVISRPPVAAPRVGTRPVSAGVSRK